MVSLLAVGQIGRIGTDFLKQISFSNDNPNDERTTNDNLNVMPGTP